MVRQLQQDDVVQQPSLPVVEVLVNNVVSHSQGVLGEEGLPLVLYVGRGLPPGAISGKGCVPWSPPGAICEMGVQDWAMHTLHSSLSLGGNGQ